MTERRRFLRPPDSSTGSTRNSPAPMLTWQSVGLNHLAQTRYRPPTNADGPDLPFEFRLGWVGYLGYELKAEVSSPNQHQSDLPDAVMMFLDRALVITITTPTASTCSHCANLKILRALPCLKNGSMTSAHRSKQSRLTTSVNLFGPGAAAARFKDSSSSGLSRSHLSARHGRHEYLNLIDRIQRDITDGETYEVCLTNMLEAAVDSHEDALANVPAPTSGQSDPVRGRSFRTREAAILSTSPERFLRIGADGRVESKPIKGTRPRGANQAEDEAIKAELAASVKDRSENLMIVDLVRHDLGRTAELGSVQVDTLFGIESYATVHQMVSTVSSRLAEDASPGGECAGGVPTRVDDWGAEAADDDDHRRARGRPAWGVQRSSRVFLARRCRRSQRRHPHARRSG